MYSEFETNTAYVKKKHEEFKTNENNIKYGGYFNENPLFGNKRLSLFGYYQLKTKQNREINFGPKTLRDKISKNKSYDLKEFRQILTQKIDEIDESSKQSQQNHK